MILGTLAMIVANGASLLGARAILARVRTGRPAADAVLFLVLRLLLISGAVLLAGLTRALGPLALGLAGAVAIGGLAARGAHRHVRILLPFPWNRWLTLAAGIVAVRLLLQVWFFAPYYGDVLSYHLPKVAEWVRAGGFTSEVGTDPRATFPAGFELLEIWWTVFLRHDVLIEMAGVELLLLTCASAYALAREFGWSSSCAMGAAIAVALIPGLHLQATSCMNDGAVTGWIAAAAALAAARVPWSLLVIPAAMGVGTKPTMAFVLPGLALFAFLSRREPAAPAPGRPAALLLAGGALLVGSFWYLRNLVFFGNPIHPMGASGMAGATGLPLQQFGPGLGSLVQNLRSLLDVRVYDHVAPPSASHRAISNWGAAAFAVGFPAIVAVLRTEVRLRRLAGSFLISLLVVWAFVLFDLFSARFVLFVPVAAALAAARFAELHRWAVPILALALGLQFAVTFVPAELGTEGARRLAAQPWRERTAAPRPIDPSLDRPVGYLSDYSGTPYWLYGPGFARAVVYLRAETLDALSDELRAKRIRVVVVGSLGGPKEKIVMDEERRGVLRAQGILVR